MQQLNSLLPSFNSQSLFTRYAYLVPQILRKLSKPQWFHTEEELMMYGYLALTDAVERYKPQLGVSFERYARMQVQAKILFLEGYALASD